MSLTLFALGLFTRPVAVLTKEVGAEDDYYGAQQCSDEQCSTDPGHTASDHVLLQKEASLITSRTSSRKTRGKEAQVSTLKAQGSLESSTKNAAPEFQVFEGKTCRKGPSDPDANPKKMNAALDACKQKCIELGDLCVGFNTPSDANSQRCWFRTGIAGKQDHAGRICYQKVVTENTTPAPTQDTTLAPTVDTTPASTEEATTLAPTVDTTPAPTEEATTPAPTEEDTTPAPDTTPVSTEEPEHTSTVTLPVGHIVALHNVGSNDFLSQAPPDPQHKVPPRAGSGKSKWKVHDDPNVDCTGSTSDIVPAWDRRFYVARAGEDKVALYATYSGKWMYCESNSKSTTWKTSPGQVQEVLEEAPPVIDYRDAYRRRRGIPESSIRRRRYQPTLPEVTLEVVPAADGKVKLKSEEDKYIMAEPEDSVYRGVYAQPEDSSYMNDHANRSLWTVIDLGPLALPLTASGDCRHDLCPHAGPNKTACKVLR